MKMRWQMLNKHSRIISALIGLMVFLALPCLEVAPGNAADIALAPPIKSKTSEATGERLTPNNPDEVIFSILQSLPDTYVDVRVPKPDNLILVRSDLKPRPPHLASVTYASNLDGWKKINSHQEVLTSDILFLDVSVLGPDLKHRPDLEEAQERLRIYLGDDIIPFGNVLDTYMSFDAYKGPNSDEELRLAGVAMINKVKVGVYMFFFSPELTPGDLERCQKIMSDYFLKIREVNTVNQQENSQ